MWGNEKGSGRTAPFLLLPVRPRSPMSAMMAVAMPASKTQADERHANAAVRVRAVVAAAVVPRTVIRRTVVYVRTMAIVAMGVAIVPPMHLLRLACRLSGSRRRRDRRRRCAECAEASEHCAQRYNREYAFHMFAFRGY